MRALTLWKIFAATIALVSFSEATFGVVTADAAPDRVTMVPLGSALRQCDFTRIRTAPMMPRLAYATGSALIHITDSHAVAEVLLLNTDQPGGHYHVGLIQVPRPTSTSCDPGDLGTAFAGLDLDAAGRGTATIQDIIRQGTTGVWIIIKRPNGNSQNPAELYTSDFVVPI